MIYAKSVTLNDARHEALEWLGKGIRDDVKRDNLLKLAGFSTTYPIEFKTAKGYYVIKAFCKKTMDRHNVRCNPKA